MFSRIISAFPLSVYSTKCQFVRLFSLFRPKLICSISKPMYRLQSLFSLLLGGSISASLLAISPSYVLERNPALLIGKPNFESKGLPIDASHNNNMKKDAYQPQTLF